MKLQTRTLLRVHRYCGLLAAPLILFFAISGAWQVFRLQQDRKDGSYTAPQAIAAASDLHMAEHMARDASAWPFKIVITAVCVLLVVSTILGIVVALRLTRPRWLAIVLLVAGAVVPPLLYVVASK